MDMIPGMSATPDISLLLLAVYTSVVLGGLALLFLVMGFMTLPMFFVFIICCEAVLRMLQDTGFFLIKMMLLTFRGIRRNLIRTSLTYVLLFVFTGMLTMIYSVIWFLGKVTEEKETDVKVIMTEKFQIPSQMPPGYARQVAAILEKDLPREFRPVPFTSSERAARGFDPVEYTPGSTQEWNQAMKDHFMIWGFVGGSTDPNVKSIENSLFLFALEPHSLLTMMDGLSNQDMSKEDHDKFKESIKLMEQDKRNIILGKDRLALMNKKVGDELRLYGLNYKDIIFEFKIVGEFPDGRYNTSAAMRFDYLESKLDNYKQHNLKDHPLSGRCLNLIWIRLPSKPAYEQLANIINEPGKFSSPAVKMETASAGIGSFLDAFKDIFWACKFILMPALVVIMSLVVAISMTISVRERWSEMAVLKVLGFKPNTVFLMVLGEGMLIGFLGGAICTWSLYATLARGIKFPIAFFSTFYPPDIIVVYGPLLGMIAAGVGTFLPAWSARKIKASEVFSQVA